MAVFFSRIMAVWAGLGLMAGAARAADDGFWQSQYLLGDLWGARADAQAQGVTITLNSISDAGDNVSGGQSRGSEFDTLSEATLKIDSAQAFGWEGGIFYASAFASGGKGISARQVGSLSATNNIESTPNVRLFELYYEQAFWDGAVSVRAGQMSADIEFLTTNAGSVLINSSFGWLPITSNDLPDGGVAYPLGTPGVRVAVTPAQGVTWRTVVFNGDPAGNGGGDPQQRDPAGTAFRMNGGLLAMSELEADQDWCLAQSGWAAACKIGGWYENHAVDDLRYRANGVLLADPDSTVGPRHYWGDWGVYASMERDIWHLSGDGRVISLLVRAAGGPDDRNLVSFWSGTALVAKGILPERTDDALALGGGLTVISDAAREFASETHQFGVVVQPARANEMFVEATYQMQVTKFLSVQPDVQYVVAPGGLSNVKNATVLFVRSTVNF